MYLICASLDTQTTLCFWLPLRRHERDGMYMYIYIGNHFMAASHLSFIECYIIMEYTSSLTSLIVPHTHVPGK